MKIKKIENFRYLDSIMNACAKTEANVLNSTFMKKRVREVVFKSGSGSDGKRLY